MVTPHGECKVVVNGVPIVAKTKLQHLVTLPAWSQNSLSPTCELGEEDPDRFLRTPAAVGPGGCWAPTTPCPSGTVS